METEHRVVAGDARDLGALADDSVDLVVTSPPYPMIELWDDTFSRLNPEVDERLAVEDGRGAFAAMHDVLDEVWREVARVLVDGGIACVNVGDATRTLDGSFRVYQNHSRIIDAFEDLGFDPLPEILWRKPTNSGAKFMGSGMLPPNAYATLEHEYVLVFRNGATRRGFEPHAEHRYEAAYFWEERNRWFSDLWTDVRGERQALDRDESRERSAAYPFTIPYRLVNMYSVYGDTVLDPFWGTGTTGLAAMVAGRNSVGYELDADLVTGFADRAESVPDLSRRVVEDRLDAHRSFVERKREAGDDLNYQAKHYDFPVTTKQERSIALRTAERVEEMVDGYRVVHEPATTSGSGPDPSHR